MTRSVRDPRRPTGVSRDVALRIAAIVVLTLDVLLWVIFVEELFVTPNWFDEFIDDHFRWLLYGVPAVAVLLIGLSISARRRS